eukprot:scaffold7281_cov140-Isochrysis_galbana.AAC.1
MASTRVPSDSPGTDASTGASLALGRKGVDLFVADDVNGPGRFRPPSAARRAVGAPFCAAERKCEPTPAASQHTSLPAASGCNLHFAAALSCAPVPCCRLSARELALVFAQPEEIALELGTWYRIGASPDMES